VTGFEQRPPAYDETVAERLRRLLAVRRDVVEKKMMGALTFMVKGHMCCGVSGRNLMVRVGPEAHAPALTHPHVRSMQIAGRRLSGFVKVDPDGYRTDRALVAWVERGLDFVSTLPSRKGR
jgi:hypothetical protein